MTRESFDSIELGTPITQVRQEMGEPYSIRKIGNAEEYEYLERIDLAQELVAENHYFLKVVDGKVVSKKVKTERQPAYDMIYQEDPNYPSYP